MTRSVRGFTVVLALFVIGIPPHSVHAQGLSSAAIDGHVFSDSTHNPLAGATVTITNTATGAKIVITTRDDGRFHVEDLPPGGPYVVDARAMGFTPQHHPRFMLALGERYTADLTLTTAATTLETVRVSAARDAVHDANRTGRQYTLTDTTLHHLPILTGDFTELLQDVPGMVGNSIAGINNRYNNYLVDGALNTDFFGLSRGTGTPGGQEGTHSLPLDAIDAITVLPAPYDVRQGNFVAGQIDATTRSGTNEFHGSAFSYYGDQSLVGTDTRGQAAADFRTYDYGFSLGGPIIRDRLHFFVATEERQRSEPYNGPTLSATSPISVDSAAKFAQLLQSYGINPGTYNAFSTGGVDRNLFVKLDAPTGTRGHLELSFNYADGTTTDSMAPQRVATGDYRLTDGGLSDIGVTRATRFRWTRLLSSTVSNEFSAADLETGEPRKPTLYAPAIFVSGVGATGTRLIGGGDPSSQLLALQQRADEITDNLTIALGAHTITAGLRAQLLHFNFSSASAYFGQYTFASLSAFANGTPSSYTRNIANSPDGTNADFSANTYSAYAQDRWNINSRLTVTGGLRADVVSWPEHPEENPGLLTSSFAINTNTFIGNSITLSPRVGVNYEVNDNTTIHGGVGIFSGPMPYSWYFQAYNFNGMAQSTLTCKGAAAPAFVANPAAQPTACAGANTAPTPLITDFAPNFHQPQNLKGSIGVDHTLPWNMVGSLDATYQYALEQLTIVDLNLKNPVGSLASEGGRPLYGTIAAGPSTAGTVAATTPAYTNAAYGPILESTNSHGDYSFQITPQVEKTFSNHFELTVAYTYTDAEDRMSNRDAQTLSNFGVPPIDGTFGNRSLVPSTYDIPSQITATGTWNAPLGFVLAATYLGRSGYDFTYVVNGDANADGIGDQVGVFNKQLNDPVYVPKNAADVELVTASGLPAAASAYDSLNAFINSNACLRSHRGELLPRNACRNPWQNIMNVRVGKAFGTLRGQHVEVTLDIFDFLNLLDRHWGQIDETGNLSASGTENVPMLTLRGTDAAAGRNIYSLSLPATNILNASLSRWQMQLGARYVF